MAGSLFISDAEDGHWSPAGWVYDNVIVTTASELGPEHAHLRDTILQARTEVNGGFLDIAPWSRDDKEAFIKGVRRAYKKWYVAGPEAFGDPTFYPGFMHQFAVLLERLTAASTDHPDTEATFE